MAKGYLRRTKHDMYEILTPEGKRLRLYLRDGKLYVGLSDICRISGISTAQATKCTDYFKLEVKTNIWTGKCYTCKPLNYIAIDDAAKFVNERRYVTYQRRSGWEKSRPLFIWR